MLLEPCVIRFLNWNLSEGAPVPYLADVIYVAPLSDKVGKSGTDVDEMITLPNLSFIPNE